MGVSGAGKTTLLDCLATRTTMGVITGQMLVDGKPRDDSFQRKTGYAQQQDLHLSTSTVREALTFSAVLRQPAHVSRKEKVEYVEEVMKLLEMTEYADAVVGVPGEGLNVEQRKRLTIGVELAAKPALSSLLGRTNLWTGLSNILGYSRSSGQAEEERPGYSLHYPSAQCHVVPTFRIVFCSWPVVDVPSTTERSVKTPRFWSITLSATEVILARPPLTLLNGCWKSLVPAPGSHTDIDWHQTWRNSEEFREVKRHLAELKSERGQAEALQRTLSAQKREDKAAFREFAAPFPVQLRETMVRVFQQYWRTPSYIYSKTFLCVLSALFIGFSLFQMPNTQTGLQNQMFGIFMLMTIFGQLVQQIMPHFVTQRALYEVRERPSKAYSWKAFMISNIVVELPWNSLMAVLIFFCCSAETGGNLANLMFSLCLIFCGVLAQPSTFPRFWIFMYRLSPFTYMVSGMLSIGLANSVVECAQNELIHFNPRPNQTCGEYIADWKASFGGKMHNPQATENCNFCAVEDTNVFLASISSSYSTVWRNFGILWAYVIFNIAAALLLYYLVRVPKTKKDKKDKKEVGGHSGAIKEERLDQPSHVGSSRNSNADGEKNVETARYASITGANTPPAQEISEKA
ncbi:unnamed protein product [Alternaria alternata]